MIRSFKDKGLRSFFDSGNAGRLSVQNASRVRRMLLALDAASRPEDMNLPGYRFHALTGARAGTYSITVTGNWRITFGWRNTDAVDVDLVDYH